MVSGKKMFAGTKEIVHIRRKRGRLRRQEQGFWQADHDIAKRVNTRRKTQGRLLAKHVGWRRRRKRETNTRLTSQTFSNLWLSHPLQES